jgi:hypothetical protein
MGPVSTNQNEKNPTPAQAGVSAAGLGVTPADAAERRQLYRYEMPWRHTRFGAVTDHIAICLECKRVVPPARTRFSRSGTHGEDYYVHVHPLVFIKLTQSNSGVRDVAAVGDVPKELIELVRAAWLYEDRSVPGITSLVMDWLEGKVVGGEHS